MSATKWSPILSELGFSKYPQLNLNSNCFVIGPDLPKKVFAITLVNSINGILAIGGNDDNENLKTILRLSCDCENNCQWINEGDLKHKRADFVAIPISNGNSKINSCTNRNSNPLLQPLFHLLSILGYNCQNNSDTSFSCEKI